MGRIGRWFAMKIVGADVVGVVWLPKFPRTSAEFPPSAAATHVRASVISQCQVGSEKTSFRGLHYVGLCILSRNRMLPSPNFIQVTIFPRTRAYLGREKQRSDKASSAVKSQCKAAEQRGFLPTSASAAARNYLSSRVTWKGSIPATGTLEVLHKPHSNHHSLFTENLSCFSFTAKNFEEALLSTWIMIVACILVL